VLGMWSDESVGRMWRKSEERERVEWVVRYRNIVEEYTDEIKKGDWIKTGEFAV
jgi:hypothetical protein